MKKLGLSLILFIAAFVFYTFSSTGYFREINNTESYEVIAELPLYGAEDFTINYEDAFMIISSDDRGARHHNRKRTGGLYFMSLDSADFKPIKLASSVPLYPHGISLLKLDSGKYQLLVVNHFKRHTIEKFILFGDSLVHVETFADETIVSPNDVVAVDENRFYFTNDHGYTSKLGLLAENYLGLSASNVYYYNGAFSKVADNIAYANGINISDDREQLIVASPRSFSVRYYDMAANGDLTMDRSLDVGTGVDNIELDTEGNLWIGSHPNLLAFSAYAAGKRSDAPTEVIKIVDGEQVESLYENDGKFISASSVAAPYKDLLFIGTVMDDRLVVLEKKGE